MRNPLKRIGAALASVAIAASLAVPAAYAKSFSDVSSGAWYADYVAWVSDKGIMAGYGGTAKFGPEDGVTRGMVATVLYRAATGASATEAYGTSSPFKDVPAGQWYTSGVAWAKSTGVVTGYGDTGTFGPNDPVTREQMATMMARYAAYVQGRDTSGGTTAGHPDSAKVSSWAASSVAWCGKAGIMNGDAATGALRPQDGATRAEAAKMFKVLLEGGAAQTSGDASGTKASDTKTDTKGTDTGAAAKKYTVTFVIPGEGWDQVQVEHGTAAAPSASYLALINQLAANTNREFTGFDVDFSNVTADLTVNPVFIDKQPAVRTYHVLFYGTDGSLLADRAVHEGDSATAPEAPAIEGKVFKGWDADFSNVTSELAVHAVYEDAGSGEPADEHAGQVWIAARGHLVVHRTMYYDNTDLSASVKSKLTAKMAEYYEMLDTIKAQLEDEGRSDEAQAIDYEYWDWDDFVVETPAGWYDENEVESLPGLTRQEANRYFNNN